MHDMLEALHSSRLAQSLVSVMAMGIISSIAHPQSSDSAVIYHLRTDKDLYEYGEQVILIHSLRAGDRPVTLYKFLEPGQILLSKVYGAMDVAAPSSEIKVARSSATMLLNAGKKKEQKSMLQDFGRAYPGTDIRYLEPTVYRVSVRFCYRIEGNLSQTFTIGDSVFFTVRRNDLVERALHRYYLAKDSCSRLASRMPVLADWADSLGTCYDMLIDSCMTARETERSPLLQSALLFDYLRQKGTSRSHDPVSGKLGAGLIDRYLARNRGGAVPDYLREAIERYRR